jgi:hypothetical protein
MVLIRAYLTCSTAHLGSQVQCWKERVLTKMGVVVL